MNTILRKDADTIVASSLRAMLPDAAVRRALQAFHPAGGRVLLVAAGKAAWQMAHAAVETLGRVPPERRNSGGKLLLGGSPCAG